MQSFKFLRNLCHFVSNWGPTAFKRSFHSILHAECSACWFECRNNPCKSQNAIFQILTETLLLRSGLRYYGTYTLSPLHCTRRMYLMSISVSKQSLQIAKCNLSNFYEISVISCRIEILRHLNALSTPFYTPNVMHVDLSVETIHAKRNLSKFYEISVISFLIEILRHLSALSTPFHTPHVAHVDLSVETIPANRKTQSFKILRNLCHFVLDWDTTALKRSFHSIIHAESIACRFQRRNIPCKSQIAIFQISTKSLSFRPWLRYYGI
jgi:hypothetical protein